ncbi:MAG: hypothetical protein MUF61_01795 [archaeon]|nr:hypothetical protein [archaeon]
MSFLDKIKKFLQEEEKPKEEKIEVIPQKELQDKVNSLVKSVKERNSEIKKQVKERSLQFSRDAENAIKTLEKIDLSRRKEYEKMKVVVLQNRDTYISCLNKFIKDIRKIEESDTVTHFNKIMIALNEFGKASHMPYEKATILIGKEMAASRDTVKQFAKDVSDIGQNNRALFEETKFVERLSSSFEELKQSEALEEDIQKTLAKLNLKIKDREIDKEALEKEKIAIKESKSCQEDMQKKENQRAEHSKIRGELERLRQRIDFKALSRTYHHDPKKAELIKSYSRNFVDTLQNDENLSIIPLVHESQSADIFELKELKSRLTQTESQMITETESRLSDLDSRLRSIDMEKSAISSSISEETKKLEKLKAKKEKILLDIKDSLAPLKIAIQNINS